MPTTRAATLPGCSYQGSTEGGGVGAAVEVEVVAVEDVVAIGDPTGQLVSYPSLAQL